MNIASWRDWRVRMARIQQTTTSTPRRSWIARLLRCNDGTTAVEYAVMLALIIGSVIAAITAVGSQNGGMWGNVQNQIQSKMTSGS